VVPVLESYPSVTIIKRIIKRTYKNKSHPNSITWQGQGNSNVTSCLSLVPTYQASTLVPEQVPHAISCDTVFSLKTKGVYIGQFPCSCTPKRQYVTAGTRSGVPNSVLVRHWMLESTVEEWQDWEWSEWTGLLVTAGEQVATTSDISRVHL